MSVDTGEWETNVRERSGRGEMRAKLYAYPQDGQKTRSHIKMGITKAAEQWLRRRMEDLEGPLRLQVKISKVNPRRIALVPDHRGNLVAPNRQFAVGSNFWRVLPKLAGPAIFSIPLHGEDDGLLAGMIPEVPETPRRGQAERLSTAEPAPIVPADPQIQELDATFPVDELEAREHADLVLYNVTEGPPMPQDDDDDYEDDGDEEDE